MWKQRRQYFWLCYGNNGNVRIFLLIANIKSSLHRFLVLIFLLLRHKAIEAVSESDEAIKCYILKQWSDEAFYAGKNWNDEVFNASLHHFIVLSLHHIWCPALVLFILIKRNVWLTCFQTYMVIYYDSYFWEQWHCYYYSLPCRPVYQE